MANYTKHYNWDEIRKYYESGKTYYETRDKFGFTARSWEKAIKRGDIIPRKKNGKIDLIPTEQLKSRAQIKQRLIKSGILDNKCYLCGNSGEWLDTILPLELDHIDGNKQNNSINNLRILCPNCHAIQPTSNGKNVRLLKLKNIYDS